MTDPRPIIVELLRNIGGRKEVEQYLRHYCAVESQKFAVIAVGNDVFADREVVAAALSFLQSVGLCPIVVHAAGPQLPDAQRRNLELVAALESHDCAARPIAAGVFECAAAEGSRGRVVDVDVAALSAAVRAGQMPIVASLGATAGGQILGLDVYDAADALTRRVQPHKLVLLTDRGGVLDERGAVLSAVNLSEDADALLGASWIAPADRRHLERLASLLSVLPATTSVSITSPTHLARELFTHRGAGTLVRQGERVHRCNGFEDIDRQRLRRLVESCFGRELSSTYFEDKRCQSVYVTEDYRATAIITQVANMPYLDKFAVTTKAQGEGLGSSVWSRMRADHTRLFWRAQADNEINRWYFQQAEGSYKTERWTVFWYGIDDFATIERCVTAALALPASLGDDEDQTPHD